MANWPCPGPAVRGLQTSLRGSADLPPPEASTRPARRFLPLGGSPLAGPSLERIKRCPGEGLWLALPRHQPQRQPPAGATCHHAGTGAGCGVARQRRRSSNRKSQPSQAEDDKLCALDAFVELVSGAALTDIRIQGLLNVRNWKARSGLPRSVRGLSRFRRRSGRAQSSCGPVLPTTKLPSLVVLVQLVEDSAGLWRPDAASPGAGVR